MRTRNAYVTHLHDLDQKFQRLDQGQQRLEHKLDEGLGRVEQKIYALLPTPK